MFSFTSVKAECLVLDCTCPLKAHVNPTTHLRLSLGLILGLARSSHRIVWPSSTVVTKTHCIAPFPLVVSMAYGLQKKLPQSALHLYSTLLQAAIQTVPQLLDKYLFFFLKCMIKKNGCVLYGTVHSICCCGYITVLRSRTEE